MYQEIGNTVGPLYPGHQTREPTRPGHQTWGPTPPPYHSSLNFSILLLHPAPESDPGTYPTGDHHWRPVQTCSLDDLRHTHTHRS